MLDICEIPFVAQRFLNALSWIANHCQKDGFSGLNIFSQVDEEYLKPSQVELNSVREKDLAQSSQCYLAFRLGTPFWPLGDWEVGTGVTMGSDIMAIQNALPQVAQNNHGPAATAPVGARPLCLRTSAGGWG